MKFFVPDAKEGLDEELYLGLAEVASCPPAPPNERIRVLEFLHDGEVWAAEVGEELSGMRPHPAKRGARYNAPLPQPTPLRDPARVLAIFRGAPYTVVTDRFFDRSVRSEWEPVFFATNAPRKITYFEVD